MPRRTDIKKILVIGSGPIVIGQACEFDYSGAQACKVLRDDGFEVVLVNSNPATIMTDPGLADRTYVEPITPEFVEKVIAAERPDALLPTLGGQTGLNCAVALAEAGILEKYGVELIGAKLDVIKKGEDRKLFAEAMERIGLDVPRGGYAYSVADGERHRRRDRAARASCGRSSRWAAPAAASPTTSRSCATSSLTASRSRPIGEVLIEESVIGWKEYEMEVMRDVNDNAVIVCSIENFDAMGVHTGDSITVAPAQTLTDREYQTMRDASIAILREIGVETGGSNVQFADQPAERPHGRHRDEPARVAARARSHRRPPASRSPRSPPSSPSATRSTRSPTTSRARRRRASSPPSTTPWSRCRAGRSRSSAAPTRRSPPA